ncbi:MAG: hypothetical protein H6581_10660 [Bacteroidia bacterium]|nr:hypothetical protein [Bacteroidia bacterium]
MTKTVFTLLFLLAAAQLGLTQDVLKYPRHAVYGELLGSNESFTPTYEYYFLHKPRYILAGRFGLPIPHAMQSYYTWSQGTASLVIPSYHLGVAGTWKINDRNGLELSTYFTFRNPLFPKIEPYYPKSRALSLNYVYRQPHTGFLLKAGFTTFSYFDVPRNDIQWGYFPQISIGHEFGEPHQPDLPVRRFRLVHLGLSLGVNNPVILGQFLPVPPSPYTEAEVFYSSVSTEAHVALGLNFNLALGHNTSLRLGAQYVKGSLLLDFMTHLSGGGQTDYFYRSIRRFDQVHIPVAFQFDFTPVSGCYLYGGAFFSRTTKLRHQGFEILQANGIQIPPWINYHSPLNNFGPMLGFGDRLDLEGLSLNFEGEYKLCLLRDVNGMFRQQSISARVGLELNFRQKN